MNVIETIFIDNEKYYLLYCPHCSGEIIVMHTEINCEIFRHAVYKKDGKFINPHTPQMQCEQLLSDNKVHGCTKPFSFDGTTVKVCGYV